MSRSFEQIRKLQDVKEGLFSSLGPLINKLGVDGLPDVEKISVEGTLAITECNSIASYNWMGDDNTTIIVPGM